MKRATKLRRTQHTRETATMMINIIIVPAAQVRLEKIAEETHRKIEDIASSVVEEAALDFFRHRKDDPAILPTNGERR